MEKQVKVKVSWNEWNTKFLRRYPAAFLSASVVPEARIHPVVHAFFEKSVTPIRKR